MTPISIHIAADACPVKQEAYRAAARHARKGRPERKFTRMARAPDLVLAWTRSADSAPRGWAICHGSAGSLWLPWGIKPPGGFMRKIAATLLLLAVCFGPNAAGAGGAISKHKHFFTRGCAFEGRAYGEGDFCSLACKGGTCVTQTCHHGRWVIPPAACAAGFGCPRFC